ncbi:MAG: UDP-N-acetylglucosamine 1-carboxyvinyltransferase, partial [Candidatus Cloacimonetes bacterium]|nr:UDP-N-acetylglucosamine 1-carboxyvinyltransferase [Candidatus Cloacimonadota bacterium]
MDKFLIRGGNTLSGSVKVSGAKNAVLPIMAAALLTKGETVLHNVPAIIDVKMMAHLLRVIGARVDFEGSDMIINTEYCSFPEAPYELVSKMRASFYVLGPLLARFGRARVSFPGGCAIGTRPVDLHLNAMKRLGAKIETEGGYVLASTTGLQGCEIYFDKFSVGATANALMASATATGKTHLLNAAQEPEIGALVDFLNAMGARISG